MLYRDDMHSYSGPPIITTWRDILVSAPLACAVTPAIPYLCRLSLARDEAPCYTRWRTRQR